MTTSNLTYTPLYDWQPMVLSEVWGAHAKAWRADDPARPGGDLTNGGALTKAGCYHALVLEPDPLRNRPLYNLQVERYVVEWIDGVRTAVPDVLPPSMRVVLDAKMQLVPAHILIAVPVEFGYSASTPVHIVQAMQFGLVRSMLDTMGGKAPSLLHKV